MDSLDEAKRGARRRTWADKLDDALLALLTAAGLLHHQSPATYYTSLLVSFAALFVPIFAGAALVTFASTRAGTRIQGPRLRPSLWAREAFESARAMYVAACLMAWPMTAWRLGRPTNLIWSIDGLGAPLWRVVLQMLLGVVVMDAWLYWKHRLLHTRLLFPLHNAPWPSESRVEKLSGSLNVNTSGSQLLPRSRSALHITGGGTTISSSDCSMPIDNQLSIPSLKQRKKLRERRDQQ